MRIMAVHNGETKPYFESALEGPHSPSPSLLIERHDVRPSSWQTVVIPEQILTLNLRRCAVGYQDATGECRCLTRAKDSVVIEKRGHEQTFRWTSAASLLAVQVSDAVLEQAAEAVPAASVGASSDDAIQDVRLTSLLLTLERERMQGYPAGRLFVDGIEQALAAILVRYEGVARRTREVYKGGLAPYRMKRISEFIHAHIEKEITLNELARDVGLSPSHFCSLFRKTAGTTPHQFVVRCRIQHAKSLLTQSRHSILDVALASGFRTHQHFSRIFRRVVGVPPSAYRDQC